jgi:enoyl-[acyl-carrier protein] reductase II
VATPESSAHRAFKDRVTQATEGETSLELKQLTPVRLLHNPFALAVQEAEARHATEEELRTLLGRGRAKRGMFEGDLVEGELEIGQVSSQIEDITPAAAIVERIVAEYLNLTRGMEHPHFHW